MSTDPVTAIVDGDVLLYRAAFVAEEEASKALAAGALRAQLQHIKGAVRDKVRELGGTGHSALSLWLSPRGPTFRHDIATIRPYKGNRLDRPKPVCLRYLRQLFRSKYGARYAPEGQEADDAISRRAWKLRNEGRLYVVVSPDKDLDQIPGCHYDPIKHVWYRVTEEDARLQFWRQVLSGDPTDNVPGACGVGSKGAARRIAKWSDLDDRWIWKLVVGAYKDGAAYPGSRGCDYTTSEAEAAAIETAKLVYILKDEKQWSVPK